MTGEPPRGWDAEYTVDEMAEWPDEWLRERLLRLTMKYSGVDRDGGNAILRRVGDRIVS